MMTPLYLDNHLLALNKPGGLLTQPSGTDCDNLEDRAKALLKERKNKPGAVFLHAVHRLDRPVSGIVLFACTSKALSRLNEAQRQHQFRKTYHAWIDHPPPQNQGILEHTLRHADRCAEVVPDGSPGGKRCRLDYRILQSTGSMWQIAIELHTGRYHQIRAQWAAVGCPIIGDVRYGSTHPLPEGIIALHHARLELPHPVRPERLCIEAPPPALAEGGYHCGRGQ